MKFTVVCLFIITISVIVAQECHEGQTKTEDCNNCRCANGNWACTRKFCLRKREALDANHELAREKREVPGADALATSPCAPNDYFQIDCNVCYCKTDGTGYLCTDNNCSDEAWALSTTTHIPLSNDSMLIMSNYGIELIENLNSNDNSISRIAKSLKSSTLSHETVDPEIIDLETVGSQTANDATVDSQTINDATTVDPETAESGTVEPQTVESQTVESQTVESQTVESQTVESQTVESQSVESETVKAETVISGSVESQPKNTERKSSPRNPLIIADEQRRLAALRNQ